MLRSCVSRPPFRTLLRCLLGSVLLGVSGCGPGGSETGDESIKGPANVEQAARLLDLSTFPLMDNAEAASERTVANLSYQVASNVKAAFEFQQKKLTAQKWKELPNNSVTEQAASGMFGRNGFVVSVSAFPSGESGHTLVVLHNFGNVSLGSLPRPGGTKPVYVGDAAAMYVTDAPVPATAEACRKLMVAQGWQPYGVAGDSSYFKQKAIRIGLTVAAAPAQGGKTMISFASELMSADLPVPENAEELRYADSTKELSFAVAANKDAVVAFYKKALAQIGWKSTLEKTVDVDEKPTMIFRNPAKDMLTLSFSGDRDGKLPVSLQFQSAAEIAELDRQIKASAPAIKAKIKAQMEEEAAQTREANKPLPVITIVFPNDAAIAEQTTDTIKFSVAHGKAKALVEDWRKQFRDTGWKENIATMEAMAGTVSLSKEKESLTINYTDTGFTPSEINLSAMGATLEPSSNTKP